MTRDLCRAGARSLLPRRRRRCRRRGLASVAVVALLHGGLLLLRLCLRIRLGQPRQDDLGDEVVCRLVCETLVVLLMLLMRLIQTVHVDVLRVGLVVLQLAAVPVLVLVRLLVRLARVIVVTQHIACAGVVVDIAGRMRGRRERRLAVLR